MAALAGARSAPRRKPARDPEHVWDCIVVGAGASGLTLARELTQPPAPDLPPRDVLVLEAGPRIGGRIHTDRGSFGLPVELGAEYVHMPPLDAVLWREIDRYRIPLQRVDKTRGFLFHPRLGERAMPMVEATLRWNIFKVLGVWKALELKEGVDIDGEEYLHEQAPGTGTVEQDFKRMILSGHLGAIEDELSMRGFTSDHIIEQLKSTKEYYVRTGYDSLLKQLGAGLDVRTGQRVRRITTNTPECQVETESGEVFRARCVAVTVSVGVLKAGHIEFVPALPERKAEALRHLEMSHHTKVHIEFTKPFWPDGMSMLQRPDRYRRVGKTYFLPYAPTGKPHLLTALIMGSDSAQITPLSQPEVLRLICSDLSECFPDAGDVLDWVKRDGLRRPHVRTVHWHRDPHVLGGVSYVNYLTDSPISADIVRASYASSLETPALFWAGEAASIFEQASSVHGAHSAALRASLEIQAFLEKKPARPPEAWALEYHQLYGMREAMKWHPDVAREPRTERDTEKAWEERTAAWIHDD